jgi:hypothetical protein
MTFAPSRTSAPASSASMASEEPAVLEAAWHLEEDWTAAIATSPVRPDVAGAIVKRLLESVWKVAGLLALDRGAREDQPP